MLRIVIVGPGRAGGALGLAAQAAGHEVVGVQPGPSGRLPAGLDGRVLDGSEMLPPADLLVVAVRDDLIGSVADALAPRVSDLGTACHLSGFRSILALSAVGRRGVATGSLHLLQTLPDPHTGAGSLAGAWAGITGDPTAATVLSDLAVSLGMRPFPLPDDMKPPYHAAAGAASNFVAAALAVSADLLAAAGVPFEATRRLTETVVRNVHRQGAAQALTGPIVRGDAGTVGGHITAAEAAGVGAEFRLLARACAVRAGTVHLFPDLAPPGPAGE